MERTMISKMHEIEQFYKGEILDSLMYSKFSEIEKDENMKKVFITLSEIEKKHSIFWKTLSEKMGIRLTTENPSFLKIFYIITIRKLFGLGFALKALEGNEDKAVIKYYNYLLTGNLNETDKIELKKIVVDELVHETFFVWNEDKMNIDNVKDGIYGMSDGLVEVLAAVSGFAAIIVDPFLVAIGGLIVGIAGTLSMSVGAYISSKSQYEVERYDVDQLRKQVNVAKDEMKDKLKDLFLNNGLPENDATRISDVVSSNESDMVRILSKEYLNFSEKKTENPVKSAKNTGISYIIGMVIPIIPYLLGIDGVYGIIASFIISAIALSFVGSLIAIAGGTNKFKKIFEFIILGLGAATITYIIGSIARILFHITVL
ncbi:MAG: VIT1/CCC1 transporter family protein [Candidatus Thermoplasmatota archaeon]|nr:VIT1/CCC1 transporter family protein [Candidatus Thermoplasmatota archaeon]MCL5962927.1 VIT1/CCC1 transporter family protein [Candidatus Thermoplasmatota archaeon]